MTNLSDVGYAFTLNKKANISDRRHITGREFRQAYGISEDQALYLDIEGRDEEIQDMETIDLARDEVETFYTLPRHPVYNLRINGKSFEWRHRYILGEQLRKLGEVPDAERLLMSIQGSDETIESNQRIDLGRLGVEEFYSVPVKPDGCVILSIETPKGKWTKHPFSLNLTVVQLIGLIVQKFNFATDGNYQVKVKGSETLDPGRTLESYNLKDCTVLCFTDLGKGA